MRVQFEITSDEMVDTALRAFERSAAYRARRTRGVLLTGLFTGALMFFVGYSNSLPVRLVMSVFGAIVGGVVQIFIERWGVERRLHEHYEEQLGTDEAVNFQVELTPAAILTEGQGTQVNFAWTNVEEIAETDDSIDFFMRNGGLLAVRKYAFSSTEERRLFQALAAEYHAQPRSFAEPAPHE